MRPLPNLKKWYTREKAGGTTSLHIHQLWRVSSMTIAMGRSNQKSSIIFLPSFLL